jgi:putative membrane protein
MVDDHTKANDQLKQIAQQQGIQVPDQLDAKDAATKARLEKLSGKEFDRAYMHDMVMDHTKDVTEFKHEANSGKDSAVKSFAQQTVSTLEDHLKEAKNIAPKVGAKSERGSGAVPTSHSGSEQ